VNQYRKPRYQSPLHRVKLSNGSMKKLLSIPVLRINPLFIGSSFPTYKSIHPYALANTMYQSPLHRVKLSNSGFLALQYGD